MALLHLGRLAEGTAEDYENQSTESMDFIVRILALLLMNTDFAACNECEFEDRWHKIISNISNTMTDRAALTMQVIVDLN